jgi:ATP-dependent protease ClpP protease subunit
MARSNGHNHKATLPSLTPGIRLFGAVDEQMLQRFLDQAAKLEGDAAVVFELSTVGGEADTARRLAQEVRMLSRQREVYFFGKTYVYSAGITIMAAVPPERRFLTRDTVLLIHERRIEKDMKLSGALRSAIAVAKDTIAELEIGQQLEREGFEELVSGSACTTETLLERVMHKDWYMRADEALELKLVAGLVD